MIVEREDGSKMVGVVPDNCRSSSNFQTVLLSSISDRVVVESNVDGAMVEHDQC